MPDKMIVTGLGRPLDGEYEFDLAGMFTIGHPDCLTNREGHTIKQMTGLRAGEFQDALSVGDSDTFVALATVVLNRAGKRFDPDLLWDSPIGAGIQILPEQIEEDDDDIPPASGQPVSAPTALPETSGGSSSTPSSDATNGSDPSRTGSLHSATPSPDPGSDPVISPI